MTVCLMLGASGALISSFGTIRYIRGIIKSGTKPRLASWIAWTISWIVVFIVATKDQSYVAAAFALAGVLRSGAVTCVTLYKSARRRSGIVFDRVDLASVSVSLICLLAYVVLAMPIICVLLAAAANWVASFPTIYQTWKQPHLDDWRIYSANLLACFFCLLGVFLESRLGVTTLAGPMVSLVGNGTIVLLLVGRRNLFAAREYVEESTS